MLRRCLLAVWISLALIGTAAAQEAPRVPPQEPGPDGGLVHVVGYGDTVQGILAAYANYGVTLDSLKQLNGWRFPPDFIFVGQQIIILPPGSTTPGNGIPVPASAPAPEAPAAATLAPPQAAPSAASVPFVPKQMTVAEIAALLAVESVAPFLPSGGELPPASSEQAVLTEAASPTPAQPPPVPAATEDAQSSANPTQTAEVALAQETPTQTQQPPTTPSPSTTPAETPPAGASNSLGSFFSGKSSPSASAEATQEAAPEVTATAAPTQTATPEATEEAAVLPTTSPTSLPAPTITSPAPEVASLAQNSGTICVSFFEDANHNTRRDGDEQLLAGGQVSIGGAEPQPNADAEPLCIPNQPPGVTTVQALPPDGYGLTTATVLQVQVAAGRTSDVNFGAAQGVASPIVPTLIPEDLAAPLPSELQAKNVKVEDKSLLDRLPDYTAYVVLAAAGVVLVVGGVGIAVVMRFMRS